MGLIFKSKKSKPTKNPSVISFLNQKGGVGKTTMCFNTAHALNKLGRKVLCIDMDPQANLSLLCGIELGEDDYSVFNLLINSIRELKPLHTPVMALMILSIQLIQALIFFLPTKISVALN